MNRPAYSPDLARCNFSFSGYMKEQLKERSFADEEEVLPVPSGLISEIPPDMSLRVFADWNRRLRLCLVIEGEYVE
jgi:hypothetical protein